MNVFNQTIKALQRDRSAFKTGVDYLRDGSAYNIADRLLDIKRDFSMVLDLQAHTGHLLNHIENTQVKSITLADTSLNLLNKSHNYPSFNNINLSKKLLDSQKSGSILPLPFPDDHFDAILSNLALHWENDLLGCLIQIRQKLKDDGVFIGCIFGGDTLFELRTCLQLAEIERLGGFSPHISPMADFKDMGGLLSRAGLGLTTVDLDEIVVSYPSMFELMMDLNAMGEGNAINNRKGLIHRDTLISASAIYKSVYGNEDGTIPATFQIIYLIGWKPCDTQPKPLERGSANVSLKKVLEK